MKQDIPNKDISYRETWIILREIKAKISRQIFRDCLVVGASQENRYCLNPGHCDYRRNPVDRIRNLIMALVQNEATSLAIEVVNLIAAPLDSRLIKNRKATPDKETIYEECIDDYCAKTTLDNLIRSNASLEAVMQQAEKCKEEIEETVAMYRDTKLNKGKW